QTILGDALRDAGRPSEALEVDQPGLDTLEKMGPADDSRLAMALAGVGADQLALGRPAQAVSSLERANAIVEKLQRRMDGATQIELDLARALWASGGDRARTRSLVETALHETQRPALRRKAQQWLDEHR